MSETGLVFLQEDRSAFSVSLVLLENTDLDGGYEVGLSEKDLNIIFNDIDINTKTDEHGFFSIDFPAVKLIKIYTEDNTIKKLVDSKLTLESLFNQDSSEITLDKYMLRININPLYEDTVELYFPPQVVEHTSKIDNSRLIIKKETDKYFYKLVDGNGKLIFGSPYGNGFFRAYSTDEKEKQKHDFSMQRQLIIMEKQLKQESYIDNMIQREISLDTVEVFLTGFNFYKDTGSVYSHQGEKSRITLWDTGEVSFLTNNVVKEFFLTNSKGNTVFFSLNNKFIAMDSQESQIISDTIETVIVYDTNETYFYEDTLEFESFEDTWEVFEFTEDTYEQLIVGDTDELVSLQNPDTQEIFWDIEESSTYFDRQYEDDEDINIVNDDIETELFVLDTAELAPEEEPKVDTIEISFYLTDTQELTFNIFEDSEETDILKYTTSDTAEIEWNELLSDYNINIKENKIVETIDEDEKISLFHSKNIYLIDNKQERYILFLNKKYNLKKTILKPNVTTDHTD